MDPYGLDMNDPRVRQMLMQMRAQQGGGVMPGGAPQFQSPQMPQAAPAVQAPLQNGTAAQPPQGSLDPQMVDAVLALQGQGTQRRALDRNYLLADRLRADAKEQTQSTRVPSSTGGIVVAPSWVNGLTAVAQNVRAGQLQSEADEKAKGLDAQRQAAAKGFLAALSRGNTKRKPDDDAGGWGSLADY